MNYIKKKINCRLCKSKKLVKVFNLCTSPLANNLAISLKQSLRAKKFPLHLMFCKKCKHIQLEHVVDQKKLYSKYLYMTGISTQFKIHFKQYADTVSKYYDKNEKLKVLEIGSNDCTLLNFFKQKKWKTVGVEPAKNLYKKSNKSHEILNSFYNAKTNLYLKTKYKNFDLIVANNVFAHIDNLQSTFTLLQSLMNKNSLIVFEVSYLLDVIKKKLFDTIYHEHLDYHSIIPLIPFFKKINLKIFYVERVSTHGGSIRIYIAKKDSTRVIKTNKINQAVKKEKIIGLNLKNTYINFYKNLNNEKKNLSSFFNSIKNNNQLIYGYGAPAKAVTLINYFNLNHNDINLIIDDSRIKQNKYIPGTKIKILNSKILGTKPPKFIVILAWNVYKDILIKLKNYKEIEYAIIPLPKFRLIKL